jgi:hypothetical protein
MRFTRWDEVFDEKDTHATVSKLETWHLSQIKSASTRERISGVLSAGPLAVCKFDFDYAGVGPQDSYHSRQCLAFYQKRADLELGIDKRSVALNKFCESERICAESNHIFKLWASGGFTFPPDVEAVFYRAQRIIARILGDVPSFSTLNFGFGPGATTQIKRKISSARSKLGQKFCCSEDLVPAVSRLLSEMPAWLPDGETESVSVDIEIHPCRLSFVPKNAKTDRGICTEPSLNVMFQRGIGQYMARRLLHFGVDLRNQSKNKDLAKEGSITGALATLDLSMASDLISVEVVHHLLPVDWVSLLSLGRSSKCLVEGVEQKLQKFSSMGNGFTFPLESLIFYALAKACTESNDQVVSVYGDDIIVETATVPLLRRALTSAGFVVNEDKSYSSGPFRESCGGDYYSGVDIRPFYLRDRMSGQSAFSLHNFYVRKGMFEPAAIVLDLISEPLRLWGPDGYGDGHLLGDYIPRPLGRDRGWSGHTFDTYTLKPLKDFSVYEGDRVLPCYSVYSNAPEALLFSAKHLDPWGDRPASFPTYRAVSAFYRNGLLGVPIPGYKGYKRISIYIL